MPASPPARLPSFALYGEHRAFGPADRLHVETIAARSRLHDWEIRPHRHASLFQLLVLARGRADTSLDGAQIHLDGPALVSVPALAVHGFNFAPDVDGMVFSIDERHLRGLLGSETLLRDHLLGLRGWTLGAPAFLLVSAAAEALRGELHGDGPWRALAVDAALQRLLVAVARTAPAPQGGPASAGAAPERALAHVRRLRALVDASYRDQPPLARLAGLVGITPTQLNRVCRQVLGVSAHGVLHARTLLEAQRELSYTSMSIKQIALGLGFSDAAYFTRWFQRRTGHTPSAWRALGRVGAPVAAG
jgi:AraC family transcriptional regulator, transcriptional activator of pobA